MTRAALPFFIVVLACTAVRQAPRNRARGEENASDATARGRSAPERVPAANTAALNERFAVDSTGRRWPYPPSRADGTVEILHGETIADPYRWLEDEKSPEVQSWMSMQDALSRAYLSKIHGRDELAKRFKEILYVDSTMPPVKRGRRLFYARTHANKDKAIVYWRRSERSDERVLLDPNQWSQSGQVSLGLWVPSWDGKKVAFNQRPFANDEAVLHVIDVDTGEWSKRDVIEGTKYGTASWTPDGRGFYYTWVPTDSSIPAAERPAYKEVRFHKLGSDPKSDKIIVPKTGDPTLFQYVHSSRDGRYLFLVRYRLGLESEIWLERVGVDSEFHPIGKAGETNYELYEILDTSRQPDLREWHDKFYVITNEGAPNRRLFSVAGSAPQRSAWVEIIPEDKSAALQGASIVGGRLALQYLKNAATELRLASFDGKSVHSIPLPDIGSATRLFGLPDQDDAYFAFSSLTLPRVVYKTSVMSGRNRVWAKAEPPIDPAPYVTEQVWYPSKDGTPVSLFLVHRRDMKRDGDHATLLYGYGGFSLPELPSFRSYIYPWLEAGGIFALANLRGGGEFGKAWHDAGRGHNKQNVFDDFIAAAEYLVKQDYTRTSRLAIYGGSNGGLLVGAAITQRPDLFGAVICSQPILDMLRYPLFGVGKAWIPEYGNPENPEDFKALIAYSPYHHVRAARYPPILILSPRSDDRVDTMHARKFAAALQNSGTGDNLVLLRIETSAGHQGGDLVKKTVELQSDMLAFLFETLGMNARDRAR